VTQLYRLIALALLLSLSACTVVTVIEPNPQAPMQYEICDDALELPASYRAFQGQEGWFFFKYDLEESYPLMEQTAFMVELRRALASQGVSLVLLPVPSRAVVQPGVLYDADPQQTAFSPDEAAATYDAFVDSLEREGVAVVDVLAAAKAYDAAGGQTFFKRDLHWNTEGANAVAQATARTVREAAEAPLPHHGLTLTRRPEDDGHRGQFVSRWLYAHCGYVLPSEPLGVYTVTRTDQGGSLFGSSSPEVVLAGSSFSIAPYYYDFLAVALQSEVLNVSVGAGGALVGLDTYLLDGAYSADKPSVLVWEFPVFAPPLSEAAQRQLLGSVYGGCRSTAATLQGMANGARSFVFDPSLRQSSQSRLELAFEDLSLLNFEVTLQYANGFEETLTLERTTLVPNRGRFYLTLNETVNAALERIDVHVSQPVLEEAVVNLCTT
jgi:alginate biosynthesis protein AlgX